MITTNIGAVRKRLAGLQRRMPDVVRNAINNLGPAPRFKQSARAALTALAAEEDQPLVELFVETVWLDFERRGISVTMRAPREAFAIRQLRLKNLKQPRRLRGGPEAELASVGLTDGFFDDVNQAREAVRQWVLTEKRLDAEEAANPEVAVGRIWHLLGIHPDSTAYNYNRQFDVLPDGSLLINPHQRPDDAADLAAGAAALLASTGSGSLAGALQQAGIGGLDPVLVDAWLRVVLTVWVEYVRATLGDNFRRELRRIWKTLGRV